jgi:hypothetical protein
MIAESIESIESTEPLVDSTQSTQPTLSDRLDEIEFETVRKYANQRPSNPSETFPPEALDHYIDHPVDFIEDVFHVQLDDWQKQVCSWLANDELGYVAVAAGSGVGKSWLLSKLIFWFLTTRKGKVPCTAPTEHQLFDVLWSKLKDDLDASPELQKHFTWTQTKLFVNGHVATWYAVARTATVRKAGKIQEGLQGFHDDNLLFIVDEASGVADSSMAAVDGALTALNAKIIMTSNPTRLSGKFYAAFHKTRIELGGPWKCLNVDCRQSKWVSDKYIRDKEFEYGKDSTFCKAKVYGEFPDQEADTLISKSEFLSFRTGQLPAKIYTIDDVPFAAEQKPLAYNHPIYATREHEVAAMNFFGRIGFRKLAGRGFGGGQSRGQGRVSRGV